MCVSLVSYGDKSRKELTAFLTPPTANANRSAALGTYRDDILELLDPFRLFEPIVYRQIVAARHFRIAETPVWHIDRAKKQNFSWKHHFNKQVKRGWLTDFACPLILSNQQNTVLVVYIGRCGRWLRLEDDKVFIKIPVLQIPRLIVAGAFALTEVVCDNGKKCHAYLNECRFKARAKRLLGLGFFVWSTRIRIAYP